MATKTRKPVIDGATLSPQLKPKGDGALVPLPIGKPGAVGARAYKHAAGKSSTYAPEVVDMIYHMSRRGTFEDDDLRAFVEAKLLAERQLPRQIPATTWDQLVFLSANLTRLVIDPYREKCNSRVVIGPDRARPLVLDWPIIFGQVDFGRLPARLLDCVAGAAVEANMAVAGASVWQIAPEVPRIVEVDVAEELPDLAKAAGVQISASSCEQLSSDALPSLISAIRDVTDSAVPLGVVVPAANAVAVVDHVVELGVDFFVPDGQWTAADRPKGIFPEINGAPQLDVLAATVERLRHHRREDLIQVVYRGGIRGGADAGKAHCLGATAVTLGLGAVVGMGFKITHIDDEDGLLEQLAKSRDADEVKLMVYNFAKSVVTEVTMLARACGKSSVTNMEPEDLRALTIGVSAATGIPLAGRDVNFRAQR